MVQLKPKTSEAMVTEILAALEEVNPASLEAARDDVAFLKTRLPEGIAATAALARVSTRGVANSAGVMLRLLRGDDAWPDVERYQAYARLAYVFQDAKTTPGSNDFAHALLWLLVQGLHDRLAPLVELGLSSLRGGRTPWVEPPRPGAPDRRAVALFSLWLAARRLGLSADVPVRGVYVEVTSRWPEQARLELLAEHHVQSLADGSSEDFLGLFQLMPLEIAAIEAVRAHEGLTTDLPTSHVLFTNPIGAAFVRRGPPRRIDLQTDLIYRRAVDVLERAGRLTGGIDPWNV